MPRTLKPKPTTKKSTRTQTKTRTPRAPRRRVPKPTPMPTVQTPVAVAAIDPQTEPAAAPAPVAHARRRNTTPAMKLGAELVRFLRIHAKRPYKSRGEQAIVDLAKEAAHAASIELAST